MQGVNPIGPQVQFSPPILTEQVKNKPVVELRALEKGPESSQKNHLNKSESDLSLIQQLKLGQLEAKAPKIDVHAELKQLREKAQSAELQQQKEALAGFMRLAKHSSESVRNYGLVGLMSMLRMGNVSPSLLSSVVSNLILLLDPAVLGDYQSDLVRFAFSILTTLAQTFDQLPKTQQQAILQQLNRYADQIKNPELQAQFREFVKEPTGFHARMSFLGKEMPQSVTQAASPADKPFALGDSGLATRILQKQQGVLDQIPHMEAGMLETMSSVFHHARMSLLKTYTPYLFSDAVLIHALGYLDTVSKEITVYRRRKKQRNLAFVVHFSAVLPRETLHKHPIFVVQEEEDQSIRQYHELFASILEQGYKHIVVLMPHADYWLSYHHAKHAAHRMENVVHVVDTQLFGLGLGMLVEELCGPAMKARSLQTFLNVAKRRIGAVSYWMVPLTPNAMKNQLWYQKMSRKSVIYDSARDFQIPVIALFGQANVLGRSDTATKSLLMLQDHVVRGKKPPLKMVIEHRDLLPEASALGRYFQQEFPHCEITIAATSLYLGSEWGPFIGIAALYA